MGILPFWLLLVQAQNKQVLRGQKNQKGSIPNWFFQSPKTQPRLHEQVEDEPGGEQDEHDEHDKSATLQFNIHNILNAKRLLCKPFAVKLLVEGA